MTQPNKKYRENWRRTRIGSFIFNLKRNRLWLRRFAFVWMFLIVFEIACPILECRDSNELLSDSGMNVSSCREIKDSVDADSSALLAGSGDLKEATHLESSPASHCTDECLCHATSVPNLAFNFPATHVKTRYSALRSKDAPTLSLPPPFQPPKTA